MKIVVIARTLNEEINVDRFCNCYQWADKILIADGGSSDDTVSKSRKWNKVVVQDFSVRVTLSDGFFYNPRGEHVNFLIDWAKDEQADWIIFDDIDCVPSLDLQLHARNLIDSLCESYIFAYLMFVLGQDKWFPNMNRAGQSLWAWQPKYNDVYAKEDSNTLSMIIPQNSIVMLEHPYALLHYFYPDEQTLQRKKAQYVQTGEVNETYNPMTQFGPIEQLPSWAYWKGN